MNKQLTYYMNHTTGEITNIKEAAEWWHNDGDEIGMWFWSDFGQEWVELAVWEA